MKILVLTPLNPLAQKSGLEIRVWSIWKRLSKYHNITIVSYDLELKTNILKNEIHRDISFYTLSLKMSKLKFFKWLFYGTTPNLFEFNNKRIFEFCSYLLKNKKIDLIVADHLWLAPTVIKLSSRYGVKNMYLSHGFEHVVWERSLQYTNVFTKPVIRILMRNLKKVEKNVLSNCDYLTCIGQEEKKQLIKWGINRDKVEIIPNGIEVDSTVNNVGNSLFGANIFNLFFVGSLDYIANKDGIIFFISKIYSLLKKDKDFSKNVRLIILSRHYPNWLRKYQKTNNSISIYTNSGEIKNYLSENTICIAPIRIGCGSRVKVLEYFKYKQPVIATQVGVEGIECEHLKNIIIANNPVSFADWIIKLVKNKTLREKLGENGQQLVEEKYNWEIITRKLSKFISQTV
jgi:glycosyltransferase involved in cell wall biosynthesis